MVERESFLARVTDGYRVVIKKEIRDLLNIKEGDIVRVTISRPGSDEVSMKTRFYR